MYLERRWHALRNFPCRKYELGWQSGGIRGSTQFTIPYMYTHSYCVIASIDSCTIMEVVYVLYSVGDRFPAAISSTVNGLCFSFMQTAVLTLKPHSLCVWPSLLPTLHCQNFQHAKNSWQWRLGTRLYMSEQSNTRLYMSDQSNG